MKTYNLFSLLLVCLLFSCSTSEEDGDGGGTTNPDADADYTLLLETGSTFKSTLLNANAELVTFNPADSKFAAIGTPELIYKDGSVFSFYQKKGSCSGEILKYDFNDDSSSAVVLFDDLDDCDLTAYAIAHSNEKVYIAYGVENGMANDDYFIRVVDLKASENTFVDVSVSKKPSDLVFTNNRLFILTLDEAVTNENFIVVMDASNDTMIIEMNLGFNAHKLIKNTDQNLIVSYDELHTLMNSQTLSLQYVQYQEGIEPKFTNANSNNFDDTGRMYYETTPGENSIYPIVPAIYDFGENLVILYAYENFLTEAQRDLEYEIETTTMVDFDIKNDYMLIGYKKKGAQKGGLLRIRTGAEPAVIDNIDVDGIPHSIVVK